MTPDEHAAKAREMLAAASAVHQRLFDRVMSGDIAEDQAVLAVVGLTAALAHVHAILATIRPAPAPAPRSAAPAEYTGFGRPDDGYEDPLFFPGEDEPGPQAGYSDDSGKAVLDAQDDDSSSGWDGLS
jgi:hypothetical protein